MNVGLVGGRYAADGACWSGPGWSGPGWSGPGWIGPGGGAIVVGGLPAAAGAGIGRVDDGLAGGPEAYGLAGGPG